MHISEIPSSGSSRFEPDPIRTQAALGFEMRMDLPPVTATATPPLPIPLRPAPPLRLLARGFLRAALCALALVTLMCGLAGPAAAALSPDHWNVLATNGGVKITFDISLRGWIQEMKIQRRTGGAEWETIHTVNLGSGVDTDSRRFRSTHWDTATVETYEYRIETWSGGSGLLKYSAPKSARARPGTAPFRQPSHFTAQGANGQVVLSWMDPADNSITKWQYKMTTGDWVDMVPSGEHTTSYTVRNLPNNQRYEFIIRAVNAVGAGPPSVSRDATTVATVPAAPSDLDLIPGDKRLKVSWSAPAAGSAPITDYDVRHRLAAGSGPWSEVGRRLIGVDTYVNIFGLKNGESYEVQVRAFNGAGAGGAWSESATGMPAAQAPDAPRRPTIISYSASLAVSWRAPADNGADITDYNVRYRPGMSGDWINHIFKGVGTSTIITDLSGSSSYQVQVQAVNSVDAGDWSASATGTPGARGPYAPGTPTTKERNARLDVSWSAPNDDGGSAVTGYHIQYRPGTNGEWINHYPFGKKVTKVTHTSILRLRNGQSYEVQVQAINDASAGEWSLSGTGTPKAEAPFQPEAPVLTPGYRQLAVTWRAPEEDGGSSVTGYNVQYRPVTSPATSWTGWNPGKSVTLSTIITGLNNDQLYEVQVQAVNSVDAGDWSPSGTATPTAVLTASISADKTEIRIGEAVTLSWEVQGDAAAVAAVSITVTARESGASGFSNIVPSASPKGSVQVTPELTTAYSLRIGSTDRATVTVTVIQVPVAPTAPKLTPGDREIKVEWSAPGTVSGAPILSYRLRIRPSGGGEWRIFTLYDFLELSNTLDEIGGQRLTNGQSYEVQVRAVNENGESLWSPSANATPVAAPAAPAVPGLTPGDRQIEVAWSAPADNGAVIIDYDVQYKLTGASDTSWTELNPGTSVTLSATITGLNNGQSYQVRVRAENSVDKGGWSESASATPSPTPTAPDAPAAPTLTPGDSRLGVSWRVPGSDGGSPVTGYNVQYRPVTSPATSWTNYTFSGTWPSVTITGLANGQSYQVQVQAENSVDKGGWSESASATPATGPAAPSAPDLTPGDERLKVVWSAPADNGGAPVTDYNVRYRDIYDRNWVNHDFTGDDTSAIIGDLINGRRHEVQVQAVNEQGVSGWSESATATPATGPTAPFDLALTPGYRHLDVSWSAPASDGGSKITDYNIRYRQGSAGAWSGHAHKGLTRSATIIGLDNGQSYEVQVQAVNAKSVSLWSASATGTPKPLEGTLAADKTEFEAGETVTLRWNVQGADLKSGPDLFLNAGQSDDDGFEAVGYDLEPQGSLQVIPSGTTTYFLLFVDESAGAPGVIARVTVTLRPPNQAPAFERERYEFELEENRIGPVELGKLTATDPDAGDPIAYSITAGDESRFAIDAASGVVTYTGPGEDHETEPNIYDLTVRVTDGGGLSATAAVIVEILDVNEAPVFEQERYEFELEENRIGPVELGELTAADPDEGEPVVYALSGDGVDRFAIDTTSGVLTYTGPGEDYETKPNVYELTVSATDDEGLSAGAGVTVTVTDEADATARARLRRVNQAILPELSRTMVAGVVESVAERIEGAGSHTPVVGNGYSVAGHSGIGEALIANEEALNEGSMDWKRALAGSSFALRLGGGETLMGSLPGQATIWGEGDWRELEVGGETGPVKFEGDVRGARLGLDARLRDDLLAGVALSWTQGSFDYTDRGGAGYRPTAGRHESRMTSVYPYVGWWPRPDVGLWGTVGYGEGEVEIDDEEAGAQSSDSALRAAALGGQVRLFSDDDLIQGGTTALTLKGEAWAGRFDLKDDGGRMRGMEVDVRRLRLGLEGEHARRLVDGSTLTPSLELGLRHDDGDGEVGRGVELGGGLTWSDPARGLTAGIHGRTLLAHHGDLEEWGVGGQVTFGPGVDGHGLSFSLEPSWGEAQDGLARLWEDELAANDPLAGDAGTAMRLDAEIGYGRSAVGGRGVLTPYSGLALSGDGNRIWRLGQRLEIGPAFHLSLEAERRERADDAPDHSLMLRATARW